MLRSVRFVRCKNYSKLKPLFSSSFQQHATERTFQVKNPATLAAIADVPDIGDLTAASKVIELAAEAFKTWKKVCSTERAKLMETWHGLVLQHADNLAELLTLENGKPLAEAKVEIATTASFIKYYTEEIRRVKGDICETPNGGGKIISSYEPVGVAALITPWNFPSSMLARKISPALAAGCTVIVKPAPECPLSFIALINLAIEAGFPENVIGLLPSSSGKNTRAIGELLCTHPLIAKVSFTGSTTTGRVLMRQASGTLKRMSLELGGHAPMIIFGSADVDQAVEGIIKSRFRNAGQTCICANRIFVQNNLFQEIVNRLKNCIASIKLGNGLDGDVSMGPLIHERARGHLLQRLEQARQIHGLELMCGGEAVQPEGLQGAFMKPTVITNVPFDSPLMKEEIFGPILIINSFDTEAEVIRQANNSDYGLAGYVFSGDLQQAWKVAVELDVGMVGVNETVISMVDAPFGGVKQSGFGLEGAHHGILEYLRLKYINLKL